MKGDGEMAYTDPYEMVRPYLRPLSETMLTALGPILARKTARESLEAGTPLRLAQTALVRERLAKLLEMKGAYQQLMGGGGAIMPGAAAGAMVPSGAEPSAFLRSNFAQQLRRSMARQYAGMGPQRYTHRIVTGPEGTQRLAAIPAEEGLELPPGEMFGVPPAPRLITTVDAEGRPIQKFVTPAPGETYPAISRRANLQRKTRTKVDTATGNVWTQEYNFDPTSGEEAWSGEWTMTRLEDLTPQEKQRRITDLFEQARQVIQARARFKTGGILEQLVAMSPQGQQMNLTPGQQITPELEQAFEEQTNLELLEIDRQLKALGYAAPPEEQWSAQTPAAAYIQKHKSWKNYR
jgi:hypothetical protein